MKTLGTLKGIKDPYSRRILANVIGKDSLAVLKGTPRKLQNLVEGLTAKQLRTPPSKGKWSITQLICHLADGEIVLGFRLRMAIAESGSPLQAMNEQKWAAGLGYKNAEVRSRLELLTHLRREHVRMLGSLPPAAWKRFGMHEERGKETITRMVHMYAGHDLNHIAQIRTIRRVLLRGTR